MSKTIIDILIYVYATIVFTYYAKSIFDFKYALPQSVGVIFVGHASLFGIFLLGNTLINFLSLAVIYFVLFILLCDIKKASALLHAILLPLFMMVGEFITIIIFSKVFEHGFNEFDKTTLSYAVEVFFSKLMYFILCIISIRIFSKNENIKNQNYLSIIIVPVSNSIIMLVFRYIIYKIEITSTIYYLWITAVCLLIATSFFVFVIYHRTIRKTQEAAELRIENQKFEAEKNSFELVKTANEEMRRISHDYKNQLTQISQMNDVEEIYRYIEPVLQEVGTVTKIGISQNPTLDLIISKYTMICNNKNLSFGVNVKGSNLSYIQDYELTSLMCNLLDNALEAAEQSAHKTIDLRIVAKNMQDIIILGNSCDTPPQQKAGKLLTSKSDKQLHGIGSKSIMRVVKKYNGIYDWEYDPENKTFETTIVFPKTSIVEKQ